MKRGILELTINEFAALIERIEVERYKDIPLGSKIYAAYQEATEGTAIRLQVSEQELEMILDDAGIPGKGDSGDLQSMREKITDMLVKFREII
jgi:hypothetical protein